MKGSSFIPLDTYSNWLYQAPAGKFVNQRISPFKNTIIDWCYGNYVDSLSESRSPRCGERRISRNYFMPKIPSYAEYMRKLAPSKKKQKLLVLAAGGCTSTARRNPHICWWY